MPATTGLLTTPTLVIVPLVVGAVDERSVEQRQIALYSARTARLQLQSQQLAQRVNLHLALGGAFGDATAIPVAAR